MKFWNWNAHLLQNLIVTVFFGLVGGAGISGALASVDFLFDLDFDEELYISCWIFIVCFLSPTYFLGYLWKKPISNISYSYFLNIFVSYILIPLGLIYLVILYAYTGKILFLWEWPKGGLSWMILWFSALFLFIYVLVYPKILDTQKYHRLSRIFLGLWIPQIFMLFAALYWRVMDYGITLNRYFIFVLGVWFLGTIVYLAFRNKPSLKPVFISYVLVGLLSVFGPWNGFVLSQKSQSTRLLSILEMNNFFENGTLVSIPDSEATVSFGDRKEISSISNYLFKTFGTAALDFLNYDPLLHQRYSDMKGPYDFRPWQAGDDFTNFLGFPYVSRWEKVDHEKNYVNLFSRSNSKIILDISGYDFMVSRLPDSLKMKNELGYEVLRQDHQIMILKNDIIVSTFDMESFLLGLSDELPIKELETLIMEDENFRVKIVFESIAKSRNDIAASWKYDFYGVLFFDVK